MRKLKLLCIIVFLVFFSFLAGQLYALEIVVSNSPLEKIIKEIGIEHKIYRLQSEKEDFHFYEPTLSQWKKIQKVDLVILVGTESWAKRVYSLRKNKETLSLADGENKFSDPHLWFDLKRVEKLAKRIINFLIKKENSKKELYQKKLEKFLENLKEIQKEYQELNSCKYKEIYILGHPVFGYLLKGAGIREVTLIKGHHKEGEPSIRILIEIYEKAKAKNGIVFLTDPEFEKYRNFFEEKGIRVIKLWSGGTYFMAGSYTELLKYNLKNIKKALKCEEK
ncbi:MAG: zinc ABC transporter substrate-binding protein [Thermodesulfobacterium sp.]|nr:zinc ABC transporter substrate-binding protein [Thermodesulfobacterium sp.]